MISEEGQEYMERARPLWDYGREYVEFKTSGTPINSPLERLRLGEDLNLCVPHLAAYLFYFTEMAEAPHDYTMSFIGIKTDQVSELTETGHELHHSYGAIREMYENLGMAPVLKSLGKTETVLFLLSSFPGKSNYTHTAIDPQFEDISTFFNYIDELMAYFNQRHREEHLKRQKEQAKQKSAPEPGPDLSQEPNRTDAIRDVLREVTKGKRPGDPLSEEEAAAIGEVFSKEAKQIGAFKPKPEKACFVATAVYEDIDHPQVNALRRWRDGTLRRSVAGRLFIRLYYRVGPYLAQAVERFPRSRPVLRHILDHFPVKGEISIKQ